jgi:hypothetical protein
MAGIQLGLIGSLYGAVGDYESIATTTGLSASTMTFSSIPSTYKHLQIRCLTKSTWAQTTIADTLRLSVNGDAGSNYRNHYINGQGTGAIAGQQTGTFFGDNFLMCASNGVADTYAAGIIDILDYANTNKNKTFRGLTGIDTNSVYTGNYWGVSLISGLWLSTSAITSITLSTGSASNFTSASHFALYGIKG